MHLVARPSTRGVPIILALEYLAPLVSCAAAKSDSNFSHRPVLDCVAIVTTQCEMREWPPLSGWSQSWEPAGLDMSRADARYMLSTASFQGWLNVFRGGLLRRSSSPTTTPAMLRCKAGRYRVLLPQVTFPPLSPQRVLEAAGFELAMSAVYTDQCNNRS